MEPQELADFHRRIVNFVLDEIEACLESDDPEMRLTVLGVAIARVLAAWFGDTLDPLKSREMFDIQLSKAMDEMLAPVRAAPENVMH